MKLYFMCGLPTETDEDVLQIAELASRVIETGRKASGTRDIRCTVSIGGFVPNPTRRSSGPDRQATKPSITGCSC